MSGMFALNKLWQKSNGAGIKTSLLYTALTGLFVSVIFFAVGGGRVQITPFSLVCAAAVAGLCLGYNLIGFKVFSIGSYSVYMMFLMLGGMLLPFIYGMLFLGDADGTGIVSLAARFTGVALLTLSLVLPCLGEKKDKKNSRLFIILCVTVFILNGFVSITSKIHQIETVRQTVDATSFVVLTNGINGVASAVTLFFLCLRDKKPPELAKDFPVWKVILMPLVCGALNGSSYLCQLIAAASDMPASVQYPMITGGTVILSAAVGRVFFGERQSKLSLAGTLLAFAATFLFLL